LSSKTKSAETSALFPKELLLAEEVLTETILYDLVDVDGNRYWDGTY